MKECKSTHVLITKTTPNKHAQNEEVNEFLEEDSNLVYTMGKLTFSLNQDGNTHSFPGDLRENWELKGKL